MDEKKNILKKRIDKKANGKPTKTDKPNNLQKEAMIAALERSLGIVSQAAKKANINRGTHYDWMNQDEKYRNKVIAIEGIAIDFVESKMFQQIKNNDSGLIKFYLATKAKSRGYVERSEITGKNGSPITILNFAKPPDNGSS